ncbi:putative nuclease HARBI1 [Dendronephthya gigantea]|uniref:putative nuclease HARBI1 n=1 Tax=Dendronephthya gigantea TaxID=151771 RepID=UPI00106C3E1A|nr:putative nuclease HARBI1 [Dendronephthya gigantea]
MALYRLPGIYIYALPRVNRHADRNFRREIDDVLLYYDDNELRQRYRFGSETIRYITRLVEDDIQPQTNRNHPVSAIRQVLITLRFLASGSFQQVTGDTVAGLDKSTVSRIIRRVTVALSRRIDQFIRFPNSQEERDATKQGFYEIANFPCVIGCIDATHIRIIAPSDNEWDFVNRKRYHSINVQGICDYKGKFTNVVARWPGSTHDSHIFRTSHINHELEETNFENGVLIGDSGYACLPYLMTPYLDPQTQSQRRFNRALKITRSIIKRSFGILKRRFHVLHSEIK